MSNIWYVLLYLKRNSFKLCNSNNMQVNFRAEQPVLVTLSFCPAATATTWATRCSTTWHRCRDPMNCGRQQLLPPRQRCTLRASRTASTSSKMKVCLLKVSRSSSAWLVFPLIEDVVRDTSVFNWRPGCCSGCRDENRKERTRKPVGWTRGWKNEEKLKQTNWN